MIVIHAKKEPTKLTLFRCRRASRSKPDGVGKTPITIANSGNQRPRPTISDRQPRRPTSAIPGSIRTTRDAVSNLDRPLGNDLKSHVRRNIDPGVGPRRRTADRDQLLAPTRRLSATGSSGSSGSR